MNKNILAVAIAAAVAAPSAFAAATVYGNAHMSADYLYTAVDGTMTVGSNSSYVGVKGSEDLAGGLKAVYQVEVQVAMDGDNGSSGSDSTSKGFDAGMRNTFAGLGGGFGTVLLGKHDTPLKMASRKFDLFSDRIGDTRNLTSKDNVNGDAVKFGWDMRPSNVVAYVSPEVSGFTGILAYVAPEASGTAATTNGSNSSNSKADAWSAVVMGKIANLELALAHEIHGDAFSGVAKSMEATRLGASYDFGMVKVNALYANQDNVIDGTVKARDYYGLGAGVKVGAAGTVKVQYYVADDLKGGTSTAGKNGAGLLALGYDHALSKNTTTYVALARAYNDENATFSAAGGGHGESLTTNAITANGNRDNVAISVGVQHKF